ncbi:acyltransferase [Olleya namhaensis]|uniref:acyltransferase n=1 Tax=Olleya namhaensis TaxID=1144750 RepID=UPI00232FFDDD|nr:acyltransferase family protein [Olleya namhaensis]
MEENRRTNNNKFGLSFLRVLATFSIVVIHVSGSIVNDYDNANLFNWNIANIFDAFSRYAVPMFFMISGALLLNKEYSLNVFLNKRVKKIMFPFLFWSIIYSLLNRYVFNSESLNIEKNIKDVFYGSEYHLWFIYTLLGVYLITPILNKWVKSSSKVEIRYFLVIWFITLIISIPGLNIYFPKINLVYFSGYVGYFVLGYYLYYWTTSNKWLAIGFILSGGLVTVFGTAFYTVKESAFYYYFYEYLNLNTCLVSIGVFILFNKLKGVNQSFDTLINKISVQTFGVFLIHPLVLKLFLLLKINVVITNSLIYIPMVTILCFLVSYFSILGLKYLRFGNYIS